jgi:hypothetical protein
MSTSSSSGGSPRPTTPRPAAPNVDAQGAINAGAITARLPGFYDGTVPTERFGEAALNLSRFLGEALGNRCFAFGSVWMHSRSSPEELANMQDYVAPETLALRSCAASGVKFHDVNGNGRRDAGEPGLQGWVIWADYDDDGVRDSSEAFAVTDSEGQYVINDARPTAPTCCGRRCRRPRRGGVRLPRR